MRECNVTDYDCLLRMLAADIMHCKQKQWLGVGLSSDSEPTNVGYPWTNHP